MDLSPDDRRALTELSYRYAANVDDRDFMALGELFTEDAVLISGAGPREGRVAILEAMEKLRRYGRTFHLVGQVRLWADADGARGETYCSAHHYTTADDGSIADHVLAIRYHDTYAAEADGTWRFSRRDLDIVATTEH